MATIGEVFKRHLDSEYGSRQPSRMDELLSSYRRRMDESTVSVREVPGGDKIFDFIRKGKYDRAVELAKSRKLNPFSLFDGVEVFGKIYDHIPFVAAALAAAADKNGSGESVGQKIGAVLNEVFKACGMDSKNMFDAKFSTPNGSDDILTFVLTKDGTVKPSKDYNGDLDLDTMVMLHSIMDGGYSLSNTSKLLKYVFDNDLISTLRMMIDGGMYSPTMESMSTYGINPKSNVGRLISVVAAHPFKLHSPEMEYDDKGKFAGGSLYDTMKRVGYDVSKVYEDGDELQQMHPSVAWMLKDAILNAYVNYRNNGENFTNATDVCFSDGTPFMDAVGKLLYLCSEYRKYLDGLGKESYTEDGRERFLRELVKGVNENIDDMGNGLNAILETLSLPKVRLVLKNPLESGDKDIFYKAANFMREVWESIKPARKRTSGR